LSSLCPHVTAHKVCGFSTSSATSMKCTPRVGHKTFGVHFNEGAMGEISSFLFFSRAREGL
ncbi:hypothetical protein, partial [Bacteroides heparinolyticus]|uniref:hypothetical protein n=1 Tax=Prevotella heparinolytica TaxID=28113 RepID=UPI0035A046A5